MSSSGTKHLIECHCVLPQYRNTKPEVYHKITVFSVIEDDNVIEKYIQCNNCDIIHRVFDICKSDILHGKEEGKSIRTIDDIEISLPERLSSYLKTQNIDIAAWEQVEFIIENKIEESVVIKREVQKLKVNLKVLNIKSDGTFKVRNEIISDTMEL